jgi:long-chain fatty acid transport protein
MKKILGSVTIAAALVASPAYATNGMRLTGFGPVQQSMGGATVGAPLDAVTAVTNPAGLSLIKPEFDFAGAAFMPSVKYDAGNGMFSDTSSRATDFLPTLAAAFRANDAFTVGVAALGTAGMGVTYNNGLGGAETKTSYMNGRIAPAVAYRINDQFSVGAALNLMYAQMDFAVGGVAPSAANSFGYGATLGVTYKPADIVTIGAALETQGYFQDFSFDVGGGQTIKITMDSPMVASLGLGVTPAKGLVLALDGQWINWSATNGKNKPEVSPAGGMSFNMNWKDQMVVKLGAQYAIPSLESLKVRAGFNYGQSPVDQAQGLESLLFPAVAQTHVMLGAGYDVSSWTVNASFMYSPEAKASGTLPPTMGSLPYETKMSQTEFQLGAAMRF